MKKLLVLALLVGCNGSTYVAPPPPPGLTKFDVIEVLPAGTHIVTVGPTGMVTVIN
jgi:hypothetical protein